MSRMNGKKTYCTFCFSIYIWGGYERTIYNLQYYALMVEARPIFYTSNLLGVTVPFLQGMTAAEAEHLLADRTTFMGTKGVTSTAIVGGSNGSPPEMSWASPRGGN